MINLKVNINKDTLLWKEKYWLSKCNRNDNAQKKKILLITNNNFFKELAIIIIIWLNKNKLIKIADVETTVNDWLKVL